MTLSRKSGRWHRAADCRIRLLRVLSAGLLLCLSLAAHGWSERGHLVIAEQAMQRLSSRERDQINKIAQQLVDKDPALKQLQKRHAATSAMALTAAWLDDQRGRSVRDIFSHYGRRVPPQLQPYSTATTDDWHYSNLLYSDHKIDGHRVDGHKIDGHKVDGHKVDRDTCPGVTSGKLNTLLSVLPDTFASAPDPRDKAIVLAMLVHLVADAHQPLHGITRAVGECEHDRGGNGFCVSKIGKRSRCDVNLHQLWDRGFGSFEGGINDHGVRMQAGVQDEADGLRLRPKDWQKENLALAERIYSSPEGLAPNAEYRTWASEVVRQRTRLAAARIAHLLARMMGLEEVGSDSE